MSERDTPTRTNWPPLQDADEDPYPTGRYPTLPPIQWHQDQRAAIEQLKKHVAEHQIKIAALRRDINASTRQSIQAVTSSQKRRKRQIAAIAGGMIAFWELVKPFILLMVEILRKMH